MTSSARSTRSLPSIGALCILSLCILPGCSAENGEPDKVDQSTSEAVTTAAAPVECDIVNVAEPRSEGYYQISVRVLLSGCARTSGTSSKTTSKFRSVSFTFDRDAGEEATELADHLRELVRQSPTAKARFGITSREGAFRQQFPYAKNLVFVTGESELFKDRGERFLSY